MNPTTLNAIGLSSSLLGTAIAAFSGGRYLKFVDISISTLESSLHAYITGKDPVLLVTGLDKHRARAMSRSKVGVTCGLLMIVAGFALQIIALF